MKDSAGRSNNALSADIIDFIAALNANRVDFVLVGGYAVGVYGVIRATADIDFLYRRSPDNIARLCRALVEFGAPESVIDPVALSRPDMVTMFGAPPNRIDLLSDITGVDTNVVWAGARVIELDEQPLRVIGLAELRKNKAATGRRKDRDDLRRLPKPEQRTE